MKKKNRILILLMIFTLMLLLTSCRSNVTSQREEVAKQQFKEELETLQRLAKGNTNEVEVQEDDVYLVKTITRKDMNTKKKNIERIEKYDEEKNLLSLVHMNRDGERVYYKKYQYDERGNVIKSTILKRPFGAITRVYNYDKEGRKIGYIETNEQGEKCGEGLYKYYDSGQLKYQYTNDQYTKARKETYYNEDGEKEKVIYKGLMFDTVSTFKREYNQQGVKVKEIETQEVTNTGGTIIKIDYFNQNGKKIKTITKNGNKIKSWYEWQYDKQGNNIEFISKDGDGNIESIEKCKFDKNGNEIEEVRTKIDENGKEDLSLWVERKYDKNGKKIKIIYKNEKGEALNIHNYKYEIVNK